MFHEFLNGKYQMNNETKMLKGTLLLFAVLSLMVVNAVDSKAKGTSCEQTVHGNKVIAADAKEYLCSIMPTRETIDNFITGEKGPEHFSKGEVFKYDAELGWVHSKAIGSAGVDGSKVFYRYQADGTRKAVHFSDLPSRIHCYGDSFTHCSQTSDGETWEEYLAAHIQEPVSNYGVGGYGVYQAYRRMLKIEKENPAKYIILNIWDDDHFRSLDAWRLIRFGRPGSRCGFTLPHLRVDVQKGICEEKENLIQKADDLYKLLDEEFVYETFKDDPILQMVLASQAGGKISKELLKPLAVSFGIPGEKTANTDAARQIKKIHTEAALFATKNIISWTEEFAKKNDKKLMIILSFSYGNVRANLQGKPRFDQDLVDWLKDKPYPVIDMRDAFREEYRNCNGDIDTFLKPYYNGHHSPRGNFFTAWAMKDKVVEWLDPTPLPYR